MKSTRTQRTSDFKAKVALAVVRSTATIPELGKRFGVERDFFPGARASGLEARRAMIDSKQRAQRRESGRPGERGLLRSHQ